LHGVRWIGAEAGGADSSNPQIVQLMQLRGWSAERAAERFVVHANTIRAWRKAMAGEGSARLLGSAPWNKLHEGIRWMVHKLRRLCLEKEFGTRTLARHIVRAGIQISRASIRRILTEEPCMAA
jgi:transposase